MGLKEVPLSTAEKIFRRQGKKIQPWVQNRILICATRNGSRNNRTTQALTQDWSTGKRTGKSGRKLRQQRRSGSSSSARSLGRECCQKTAKRPTTPSRFSPRPNNINQKSSKTAVKTPNGKHSCYKPVE